MITWIGHAGFRITCTDPASSEQKTLYIDPWFDNPLCPETEKSPSKADLILLTHGHFDHSSSSAELSRTTGANIVAIHELALIMTEKGAAETTGMNKGGTWENEWCSVTMVSADHSSCGPEQQHAGAAVGFVLQFKDKSPSVYHAGDTNVFSDMRIISDLYKPTIGLLPIGGHYTMGPREAAYALNKFLLSVKTVVPMHFGTFPLLKGTPEELETELGTCFAGRDPVKVRHLQPGETAELTTLAN